MEQFQETTEKAPIKVLVIDDNRNHAEGLSELLGLAGFDARHVFTGADGIEMARRLSVDAVLLDMNLPLKSGADVLRRLRSSSRLAQIPAIVMTSSRSQLERDEIMRLGASAFFHKPISYSEFMDIGKLMRSLLPEAKTN